MSQDDGEKLIQNVARESLERAIRDGDAISADPAAAKSGAKKPPAGCVPRVLNFKDRNYIVGACIEYCQNRRGTYKDRKKLDQVRRLVNFEATEEHTLELEDILEEEMLKWEGAKERYKAWRRYQEGLLPVKDLKERYPQIDLDKGVEKPPVQPPKHDPEVERGPESTFHFPARLDVWVHDALAAMDWKSYRMTQFSVELCEKYDIHKDLGGDDLVKSEETEEGEKE